MSGWRKLPHNMLSADESYFLGRYPQHVARAFIAVDYDDRDPLSEGWEYRPYPQLMEEAMASFSQRWGGLGDAVFVRALKEGTGRDRLAAIF
ncbi:MAG: hypothetical protein J2P37_34135, partial [Ktedonobacteraceae bacterium]|nr:hypothetical protein [Ktedonobacteraceae bacterium]